MVILAMAAARRAQMVACRVGGTVAEWVADKEDGTGGTSVAVTSALAEKALESM